MATEIDDSHVLYTYDDQLKSVEYRDETLKCKVSDLIMPRVGIMTRNGSTYAHRATAYNSYHAFYTSDRVFSISKKRYCAIPIVQPKAEIKIFKTKSTLLVEVMGTKSLEIRSKLSLRTNYRVCVLDPRKMIWPAPDDLRTRFKTIYIEYVDHPIRLSRLEIRSIKSFNLQIKILYEKHELFSSVMKLNLNMSDSQLYDFHRTRLFLMWIVYYAVMSYKINRDYDIQMTKWKQMTKERRQDRDSNSF